MYYLKRKIKKSTLKDKINIDGLTTKPKNKTVKKVVLVDKKLKSNYAIKQMDKNLKKAYDSIFKFLTSEDDSANGIKICLGEIEKCKSTLFNKYKEELSKAKYKEYLAKIAITEAEFKHKYTEREYYKTLSFDITISPGSSVFIPIQFEFDTRINGKPNETWKTDSIKITNVFWK